MLSRGTTLLEPSYNKKNASVDAPLVPAPLLGTVDYANRRYLCPDNGGSSGQPY